MVQFVEKKRNRTCETPQSAMIVLPEGKIITGHGGTLAVLPTKPDHEKGDAPLAIASCFRSEPAASGARHYWPSPRASRRLTVWGRRSLRSRASMISRGLAWISESALKTPPHGTDPSPGCQ